MVNIHNSDSDWFPGNVSSIHSNNSGASGVSDEVFIQVCPEYHSKLSLINEQDASNASNDEEPNWDKLLNDAQFVALKISDPAVPSKTPLSRTKTTSM